MHEGQRHQEGNAHGHERHRQRGVDVILGRGVCEGTHPACQDGEGAADERDECRAEEREDVRRPVEDGHGSGKLHDHGQGAPGGGTETGGVDGDVDVGAFVDEADDLFEASDATPTHAQDTADNLVVAPLFVFHLRVLARLLESVQERHEEGTERQGPAVEGDADVKAFPSYAATFHHLVTVFVVRFIVVLGHSVRDHELVQRIHEAENPVRHEHVKEQDQQLLVAVRKVAVHAIAQATRDDLAHRVQVQEAVEQHHERDHLGHGLQHRREQQRGHVKDGRAGDLDAGRSGVDAGVHAAGHAGGHAGQHPAQDGDHPGDLSLMLGRLFGQVHTIRDAIA
mmetsp:Transcript_102922/g.266070  ORF Transcript_102922/g.266070 Transcript_102922/m.266070 type:complete len:339 (+) Transcript_102922:261-1277(+)